MSPRACTAPVREAWARAVLGAILAGCGADGGGVLVAAALDFGDTAVGLPASAVLRVENVGTGRAHVRGVLSADGLVSPTHRFELDATAAELAAGGAAFIPVTFTALAPHDGPVRAVVRLETDGDPLIVQLSGRGVAPRLEVTPSPVDFGAVVIGRDRRVEVAVTNTLGAPVDLLSQLDERGAAAIATVAGGGRFEVLSPIEPSGSLVPGAQPLAPGATQRILLRYTPSPVDGREDRARWPLGYCASAACRTELALTGVPRTAALVCTPASLALGAAVGERTVGRVRCTNDADERTQLAGWRLSDDATAELSVAPVVGSPILGPLESVEIAVAFAPALPRGARPTATLEVDAVDVTSGRALGTTRVPIEATAGRAIIRVPERCDAGEVPVGTVGRCLVAVANTGDAPLRLVSASASPAAFAVTGAPRAIAPGESAELTVTFMPAGAGVASGQLAVESDDPTATSVTVALSGTGVEGPPCALDFAPLSLDFGAVAPGVRVVRAARVINRGASACAVAGARVALGDAEYALFSGGARTTLAAGESLALEVAFTPRGGAAFGAVEVLVPSAGAPPQLALRGEGGAPPVRAEPGSVDLGPLPLGCGTSAQPLRLINTSGALVRLDAVALEAGSDANLGVTAPPLPVTLAPGESTELTVRLERPAAGVVLGAVRATFAGATASLVVPIRAEVSATPRVIDRLMPPPPPATDVLMVVDRTTPRWEAIVAQAFAGFSSASGARAGDWQLGVVFGVDAPNLCPRPLAPMPPASLAPGVCGYLSWPPGATSPLVTAQSPTAQADFERLVSPTVPASTARLLDAALDALRPPLDTTWTAPLLRSHATLAVVFVAARDDASAATPASAISAIAAARPGPLTVWSIAPQANDGCLNLPTPRLQEAARLGGGTSRRACVSDLAVVLGELADALLGAPPYVTLTRAPDPTTLEVEIAGTRVTSGWTYDAATRRITFEEGVRPEPGAEVVVRYTAACP